MNVGSNQKYCSKGTSRFIMTPYLNTVHLKDVDPEYKLEEINLQQYAERFVEEGDDEITQIILMNKGEIDELLAETGLGTKSGHKK